MDGGNVCERRWRYHYHRREGAENIGADGAILPLPIMAE
jgi:hypothetical protein